MKNYHFGTQYWEVGRLFQIPIKGQEISLVDFQFNVPSGVEIIVQEEWEKQLASKQKELNEKGRICEIRDYADRKDKNKLRAIYEGEKPVMWPGPVVLLKEIDYDNAGQLLLKVQQTYFPFIKALGNKNVQALYEKSKMPIPSPALAICTFAITLDNNLVLTRRSYKTPMYPGRLYGQGGNPLFTNVNIVMHQIEEMKEEIMLDKNDYDPKNFRFGGIVLDKEELMGKPDLMGWININLTSHQLKERFSKREMNQRPADVEDIVFIPATKKKLLNYLVKETVQSQYCPPAYGGLVIYGNFLFGKEWRNEVIKRAK